MNNNKTEAKRKRHRRRKNRQIIVGLCESDAHKFPSLCVEKCVTSAGYSHVYSATIESKGDSDEKKSKKRWCVLKVSRTGKQESGEFENSTVDRYERAICREIDAYQALTTSVSKNDYNYYFVKFYSAVRLADANKTRALLLDCFTQSIPLSKFIRKCTDLTDQSSQKIIKAVFRSLLRAVRCCHRAGIAHHDLKPDNILLRCKNDKPISTENMTLLFNDENHNDHADDYDNQDSTNGKPEVDLRLIDFGLAQPFSEEKCCGPCGGTPAYVAPEVLWREPHCSARVDAWSLGTILFELCCRQALYIGDAMGDFRYQMLQKDVVVEFGRLFNAAKQNAKPVCTQQAEKETRQFSNDACTLLSSLVTLDPLDRFTVDEALASRFMTQ